MLVNIVMEVILKGSRVTCTMSQKNRKETITYVVFAVIVLAGALLLLDSKGRSAYSSLMTLSAAIQCLGFYFLFAQVMQGATSCVSMRMLSLHLIVFVFRLYATWLYEAYVPSDWSGDWLYQAIETISLASTIAMMAMILKDKKDSISEGDGYGTLAFIVIAAIAAYHYHPTLNFDFKGDYPWTFGLYLETFVMMPQLFILAKDRVEVEDLKGISNFLACTFASKLFMLRFYIRVATHINVKSKNYSGYVIVASYIIQCVLLADFMYLYLKSIRKSSAVRMACSATKVASDLLRGFISEFLGTR